MIYTSIFHQSPNILNGNNHSKSSINYVTICEHNKVCLFGEVTADRIFLNNSEKIIFIDMDLMSQMRNDMEIKIWLLGCMD